MTLTAGKTSSFCRYLITGYAIFLLVVIPSFAGAAEKQPGSPAAPAISLRYRVFNLKHITAKQATEYLQMINIETKTQILNTNMLSVSAEVNCLVKASELINVVDALEKYMIKTITLPPDANGLPSYKKISEGAGTVLIGSFADPPTGIGTKVIANLESGNLLLAAPVSIFSRIEQNITDSFQPAEKKLLDANTPPTIQDFNQPIRPDVNVPPEIPDANNIRIIDVNAVEITEVNDSNLDDLLSRLVSSLEKPAETKPKTTEGITATIKESKAGEPAVKEKEQVTERQEPNKPMPQQSQLRSYEPPEISDPNQPLGITLPEKLTIEDLLRLAGEILELNYMYDPALVKGEVTIRISGKLKGELKRKDLYPLIESVLKFKGLAMTRNRNLVIIAPKEQAKDIDPLIIDTQKGGIQYGDVIISRIFDLKYIDAESAKNLLAGMNLAVDINTSASAAGKIIVTGYAFRMKRVEELIELVDKPGEMKQFRFRQLKYTMATTLKDKIKSLAEQLGTISITIAAQSTQQPFTTTIQRRPTVRMPVPQVTPGAQQTPMPTSETPSVYLDVDERTNRILMIGLPEQLDIVEELIGILDVEQQDLRSLRLYEIQHVDAEEVVKKLQELGIITAGQLAAGRTTRTYQQQQQQQSGLQRPTPGTPPAGVRITETPSPPGIGELEPLTEEPQVVIIESTNSLLVNATDEQHLRVATIIGYADNEPEQATINYVVYPLENQDPEELAKILNDLISQTVEKTDTAGKVERTTTRKPEEDITILADKNTFSIIVYANRRNQQWIESLIKQLDKRRPQVLIDVTLVEISKNDDFTLYLDTMTKYPSIPAVLGTGVTTPISLLNTDPKIKMAEASSVHGAGGNAFYADEHIQALFKAVNTKNYGRILAKPKLLVNDNEKGTINTSTIRTIVSPRTTVIPGSGTSNPTATVDVSPKEYTAEIKLDITPHISEGDLLKLEITMTRTDFQTRDDYSIDTPGGVLKGPTPPDLLTSNVQTVITVPDQRTIILGGLEKLNQTKGGTKVPILGDIPIVGGLFRNVSNTDSQNRLYVFIKANILRPETKISEESDIVKISHKGRAEFEKHEEEMQKYEDWPGIKPKPMEPVKILEKD